MPVSVERAQMNPFFGLFQAMRPWNLLMIVLCMIIIRDALLSIEELDNRIFMLCCAAMVCAAAAGNLINDYFDIREDAINKPKKALVGRLFKRRWALAGHHVLVVFSLVSAGAASWASHDIRLVLWMAILNALLWGYSPWFKRKFLLGNGLIALAVGQLPLWTALPTHQTTHGLIVGYAVLSGLVTAIRELTKDLQDIDGDAEAGYDTLPVRWQPQATMKLLKILHLILLVVFSGAAWWLFLAHGVTWPNLLYWMPFFMGFWMLFQGNIKAVSAYLKVTLGGGMLVLLFV